jgi:hypothetical protein
MFDNPHSKSKSVFSLDSLVEIQKELNFDPLSRTTLVICSSPFFVIDHHISFCNSYSFPLFLNAFEPPAAPILQT